MHSSALDREGRITAWRLLHGRLFVGAFLRHIGRGTPESRACPHHGCVGQLASLSHVMLTCPVSQAVWQWFASIWTAISQPAGAATTPCRPPPCRRQARPMAACTTVGQPLAASQAVGHHTAVDSILHCSIAAGPPGDPRAHRSQGVGSSQGPDAPRLAPGFFFFFFVCVEESSWWDQTSGCGQEYSATG